MFWSFQNIHDHIHSTKGYFEELGGLECDYINTM